MTRTYRLGRVFFVLSCTIAVGSCGTDGAPLGVGVSATTAGSRPPLDATPATTADSSQPPGVSDSTQSSTALQEPDSRWPKVVRVAEVEPLLATDGLVDEIGPLDDTRGALPIDVVMDGLLRTSPFAQAYIEGGVAAIRIGSYSRAGLIDAKGDEVRDRPVYAIDAGPTKCSSSGQPRMPEDPQYAKPATIENCNVALIVDATSGELIVSIEQGG